MRRRRPTRDGLLGWVAGAGGWRARRKERGGGRPTNPRQRPTQNKQPKTRTYMQQKVASQPCPFFKRTQGSKNVDQQPFSLTYDARAWKPLCAFLRRTCHAETTRLNKRLQSTMKNKHHVNTSNDIKHIAGYDLNLVKHIVNNMNQKLH